MSMTADSQQHRAPALGRHLFLPECGLALQFAGTHGAQGNPSRWVQEAELLQRQAAA